RDEYGEPYAGFIFLRNPGLQMLEGSTGEGDRRVQAYNYRLCLTNRDDIRVLPQRPDGYDRAEYASLIAAASNGTFTCMNDLVRLAPIPNGKFNANNRPMPRSLDYPEANTDYPDGDEACRKQIVERYRTYMTGLLWFAQNDPELPDALKEETRQWGFCKDEFADNGHIPYELYVREARRIIGLKTFTANDAFLSRGGERTPIHDDSVAVGDYHVDSHLVQRKRPEWPQYEGHVYLRPLSKPAQIPYGVMVPAGVEGLLVPGALSATHLGFSVLRMEPPWMALGQAAGTAAHLALTLDVPPSGVPVSRLQRLLLQADQVISFFYDIPGPDPIWEKLNKPGERTRPDALAWETPETGSACGMQYFAAKGWFPTYYARPKDPVTRSEAALWLARFLELEGGLPPASAACDFEDVLPSDSDYEAIAMLRSYRIVEGWQRTFRFFPQAAVSRSEAVRWIVNIKLREAEWQLPPARASRWTDVGADDPALPYYLLLDDLGALPVSWNGPAGLKPLAYINREQFCDLLYDIHFAT
ncbi:MAG: dependent oxidoreductase, partial [Paenibacillus sp.]|nr:dependent oxidoreductase [Paenibacillus sp.]